MSLPVEELYSMLRTADVVILITELHPDGIVLPRGDDADDAEDSEP